jgi:dimethylglycine dehydrogenase
VEKARESYGLNNVHNYPHTVEERPAGRPQRTNPIYPVLLAKGAEMGLHNGWEQPKWYRNG